MPGRSNSYATGDTYRYAYNGMELDNEVSGIGNSYTTEFRQYDPRLGRWKSLDPLMAKFPWMSPYVAFDNNPVYYTDIYGLASEVVNDRGNKKKRSNKDGEIGEISTEGVDRTQRVPDIQVSARRRTFWQKLKTSARELIANFKYGAQLLWEESGAILNKIGEKLESIEKRLKGKGTDSKIFKDGNTNITKNDHGKQSDPIRRSRGARNETDIDNIPVNSKGYKKANISNSREAADRTAQMFKGGGKLRDIADVGKKENEQRPVLTKSDSKKIMIVVERWYKVDGGWSGEENPEITTLDDAVKRFPDAIVSWNDKYNMPQVNIPSAGSDGEVPPQLK